MGKLDDTLIIYINGDNGTSAEGTLAGTPNEFAMFNGIMVPVEDSLKYFYDVWGTDQTHPHLAVPWAWAWELYDPAHDYSQATDVAAKYPAKLTPEDIEKLEAAE